jgi:hypothetical protein
MSLKDQLQADLKTAMLSKQELRRDVIRFTQAALKNAELAKQQKLVKERSHLWQTGKVDEWNPIINEAELRSNGRDCQAGTAHRRRAISRADH